MYKCVYVCGPCDSMMSPYMSRPCDPSVALLLPVLLSQLPIRTQVAQCRRHQARHSILVPDTHTPHFVGGGTAGGRLSGSLSAWVGQGMSTETYSWWLVYSVVNGVHICPPVFMSQTACVIISHSRYCMCAYCTYNMCLWMSMCVCYVCVYVCVCVCLHSCVWPVCV